MHARTLVGLILALVAPTVGAAAPPWRSFAQKPDDWYRSPEGRRVAENILSYQSAGGAWPKNVDTTAKPYAGDPAALQGTFDNGATTDELRFLTRAFRATGDDKYRTAVLKGFDHILQAQY